MDSPPLPQPSAHTCPNCGAAIEGKPTFCPRCGAALAVAPSQSNGCISIGIQIVLAVFALGCGLSGACFIYFGASESSFSRVGSDPFGLIMLGIGLAAFAFGGLCIWGIVKVGRSK